MLSVIALATLVTLQAANAQDKKKNHGQELLLKF
jgi:hypothetical protein